MSCGQIAPDVPEFLEVVELRALGDLGPERGVTARAGQALPVVAPLVRFGQGEEAACQRPALFDQPGIDAAIADQREAIAPEADAQSLRHRLGCTGQRNYGQIGVLHDDSGFRLRLSGGAYA